MLDFLEAEHPGSRERIWMRIPAESRAYIESVSRMEWIDLEHDHWLPDSILAEFGRDESVELFRASIPQHIQKPLLEPFVMGMIRVLGKRRSRLLNLIPRALPLVFRDFFEPKAVSTDGGARTEIRLEAIPPAVREFPAYFTMWEGVFLGVLDLVEIGENALEFRVAPGRECVTASFDLSSLGNIT